MSAAEVVVTDYTVDEVWKVAVKAKKIIATEDKWIHGAHGLDDTGSECSPRSRKCVSRCLAGAIMAATKDATLGDLVFSSFGHVVGTSVPHSWNDNHSHAEVIAGLDRTIAYILTCGVVPE